MLTSVSRGWYINCALSPGSLTQNNMFHSGNLKLKQHSDKLGTMQSIIRIVSCNSHFLKRIINTIAVRTGICSPLSTFWNPQSQKTKKCLTQLLPNPDLKWGEKVTYSLYLFQLGMQIYMFICRNINVLDYGILPSVPLWIYFLHVSPCCLLNKTPIIRISKFIWFQKLGLKDWKPIIMLLYQYNI